MKKNDGIIYFLYTTTAGRFLLKLIQTLHIDCLIVRFLRSPVSHLYLRSFVRRHHVPLRKGELKEYQSFRDFFVREHKYTGIDITPEHLISPCDGWLSAYQITENSTFAIKNSHYRIHDLLESELLSKNYNGGICLIIRIEAADYHHYCYIDDGFQGRNHRIPGVLHSVQPIACETVPVFTLNRRCWCLMATENFGPVVQTEIGALIVGEIANIEENNRFCRGWEKGHFELAGSTVVLLFEPGRIRLLPELDVRLKVGQEVRVVQGEWIASKCDP